MTKPRRVLIDFDGVMMQRGNGSIYAKGRPIAGALQAIKGLKDLGYEIKIFTTRASSEGSGVEMVESWLLDYGVKHDGITGEKLDAEYYIDDKAIAFRGNWEDVLDEIR